MLGAEKEGTDMSLGERIALARKQAGLSQEQLGDKLGVSRQAVSKWESDQTNPDVAYVAQMCRLLGVSSDWLLLGEESAQTAAPARCPGCQAIVSGLDRYCPSCGRSLQGGPETPQGYTLFLKTGDFSAREDLIRLSNTGIFSKDSPLYKPLTWDDTQTLIDSAPIVLARGLSTQQVKTLWDKLYNPGLFTFFQDCEEEDLQVLKTYPGIDPSTLPQPPREPLSFGMVVLAVVLGVVGGIFLLSIL
jgi:transcriptional regulator with XRE-family HTH domain